MANNQRTCLCCGKTYKYCNHCEEKKYPTWFNLFHDENCHEIWYVLSDFESGLITKEEAQKKMKNLNASVITNKDALASYNKLFDIKDEKTNKEEHEEFVHMKPMSAVKKEAVNKPEPAKVEEPKAEKVSVSEELKKHNNKKD